jgi:hypothetical protein
MPAGTWKVSCTVLRLVYDPAGMGSWVRLRRVGERLGAEALSTLGRGSAQNSPSTSRMAMQTLAPAVLVLMARDSPTLLVH